LRLGPTVASLFIEVVDSYDLLYMTVAGLAPASVWPHSDRADLNARSHWGQRLCKASKLRFRHRQVMRLDACAIMVISHHYRNFTL
jgi:hypothetical protein